MLSHIVDRNSVPTMMSPIIELPSISLLSPRHCSHGFDDISDSDIDSSRLYKPVETTTAMTTTALRGELARNLRDDCTKRNQTSQQPLPSMRILKRHGEHESKRRCSDKLTMKSNDRENEPQAQNQHHHRIHPQTRALIRIQLEHCARGATRACGASRAGTSIAQRFLVIRCGTTTHRRARSAGRCGR